MVGNLAELVRAAARRSPDRPALKTGSGATSWGELDAQVDAAAAALRGLGLAPGDRVALSLDNTPDFPVAYFGVLRAGLVAVPLNPGATAQELRWTLGDSGARAVVVRPAGRDLLAPLTGELAALEHVLVAGQDGDWPALLARSAGGPVEHVGEGEELAVLLYTSGTSGRPKGAMLPHRALLANLDQTARIEPPVMTADDVVLLVLPLFHVYGLNAVLGALALHGATGVLVERFDPVDTLAELRRSGVTNVVGAPPMYVAWSMLPDLAAAFTGVRLALSGAAPLPPSVLRRVREATGRDVFEGYGLTETAPVLTSTLMSERVQPGSIGRPVPGVELRLVDERGRPVEEGDPGEIVVRGPNVFAGYWPDGADGPDADGWFATGDVAYLDADGDLHLVDRRQELVLVSGFNVYPREVEDVLVTHPEVQEAAVIGVPHPYTGEAVKALVVRTPGSRLTAADVVAHAARSLARFKCPTAVEFVPELPHGATGKVRKGRLREGLV
ncbi:MAG: Long-chain-fatty-acid--CoA ligase [uncultured Frankineae bacterium]|uniref:Long-chain-fatty-acid--CoA ligase n=1 Tax=uncultured Frankineae bacterium TaxID=437475 RepID=A0A6J4M8Q0_9ACTN|nr:MAG: Long-chain-fatty-acid--CoA ligase [uncultured Frankineae bacterium]